jgi:hypothetical protein
MALLKLVLKPGIDKQNTEYGAEGGWVDGDYVRFQDGLPEKIGGWQYFNLTAQYIVGAISEVFTWNALDGVPYIMLGTTRKLYVGIGAVWSDITPVRETTTNATFSTTSGSDIVRVNQLTTSMQAGDFVIISSVTGNPGGIPNATLNGEYEIQEVLSGTQYTIKASVNATSTAGPVGTAVIAYQISVGSDVSYFDFGWGTGTWGLSTWGTARDPSAVTGNSLDARVWQLDNYGEDVVCQLVNGGTYLWDTSVGANSPAVQIAGAPTNSSYALVSTPDRHLICFGTEDVIGTPASQDPMYVRFSDQENIADFEATATNTAGGQRLTDGSHIVSAIRSRGQILIFTDTSLHGMQYVGPPYTFGFSQLGTNCGLVGPHAVADVNGVAMWMGLGAFYVFDGTVKKIPCTIQDYVFKDLNRVQNTKIHIGVNSEYNEVTWWYCTEGTDYINRFATYDYLEGVWSTGTMARTAWTDTGSYDKPIATEYLETSTATPVGNTINGITPGRSLVYYQETGVNAVDQPITAYLRSGYFDIGDGDQIMFMKRFIPDFRNFVGDMTLHLLLRAFPSDTATVSSLDPYIINPNTEKVDTRARGRQIAVSMETDSIDSTWRFGTLRVDIVPDGLR